MAQYPSAFDQVNHQHHNCVAHIPDTGISLFLEERCKIVHFIRHAEGIHNEANAKAGNNTPTMASTPGSEKYWDAPLTEKGINQCLAVRGRLEEENVHKKRIEVVFVSPLTRTLQTAQHIFGFPNCEGAPPFIVHELCRERYGLYTCDGRRPISEIRKNFPQCIDFDTYCPNDADIFWSPERESDDDCTNRSLEFLRFLQRRPEKEIAVVTHSSFLRHLFSLFGDNVVQEDKEALQRLAGNAELRSITMCSHDNPDKSPPAPLSRLVCIPCRARPGI